MATAFEQAREGKRIRGVRFSPTTGKLTRTGNGSNNHIATAGTTVYVVSRAICDAVEAYAANIKK